MISFISSFKIISAVIPHLKTFLWIAVSVANAAAVNPNNTKTILGNGVSILFVNPKPSDINGLKKLGNNPSWVVTFLEVPFK